MYDETVTRRILPPVLIPLYKSPPVRHRKPQIIADVDGDQSVDADTAHWQADQRDPRVGLLVVQFRCVSNPTFWRVYVYIGVFP